jgi:hypothetical protein
MLAGHGVMCLACRAKARCSRLGVHKHLLRATLFRVCTGSRCHAADSKSVSWCRNV